MSVDEKLRNSLHPGHKLHWYQIEKVLGQGGFGITYLAYDTNLDQHVAIKEYLPMELAVREGDFSVYPASQAQDSRYKWGLDRFLTEARTLAKFKHPAIVRVLSVFEANNTAYMVMEYQLGSSLQQILDQRRTLPEAELIAMVVPLLDGLEAIHAQGFIHRDIKPSNLFIHANGHPVLLDFGSARQALGEETRTLTSVVSPGYAPFEQYYSRSDRQGPWTDIYGLGATLYRCLTGLQPMAAIDRSEAILRAERDVFVSASEIGAGQYSASFLAAVDCALLFNETKRPQTIAEWRPYFDISRSTEHAVRDALHTTYPEDARTRFSGLIEPLATAEQGAVINPSARRNSAEQAPNSRSGSTSRPQVTNSDVRSKRRSSGLIESRMEPDAYSRQQDAGEPEQQDTASRPVESTRRWPLVTFALVLLLAGAVGLAAYLGLLPSSLSAGGDASRLVAQGDRALAAGRALEPDSSSALAFYLKAYQLAPDNADVLHGLSLSGEQLSDAIMAALDGGDLPRAEQLLSRMAGLPTTVFDPSVVEQALAHARAQAAAEQTRGERVSAFLDAAEQDMAAERYVGGGTDNALARYRAVQILDPDNVAAREGLTALAVILAERGQQALDNDNIDQAWEWHGQASLIDATVPAVAALRVELGSAREAAASAADLQAEINALLTAASADLAANRLTTPEGKNALARYQEALRLEPDNSAALDGMRKIHDRYIAISTQALTRQEFDAAAQSADKALRLNPDSEPAQAIKREISVARKRLTEQQQREQELAAEQRMIQAAQARQAAERARLQAIEAKRQREEEEAQRLIAEAEARADAERQARLAELQAAEAVEMGRPRMVLDFLGFHPKYARDGLTRDRIYEQVAPMIRAAGYEVVTRGQVHDAQYKWTNVQLLAFRLNINENTATGLYSYVGSVNLLADATLRLSLAAALEKTPEWSRSKNGMGPPSDLSRLSDNYVEMVRAFLQKRPGRRK